MSDEPTHCDVNWGSHGCGLKRGHSHPCGLCGRRPALGFASIGDHWYCHDDAVPSCYEQVQHLLAFADRSWDGLTDEEAAAEEATWD